MEHHKPKHPTHSQDTHKLELDKEYLLFHSITPGFSSDLMSIDFYINMLYEYHLCVRFVDKKVNRISMHLDAPLPEKLRLLLLKFYENKFNLKTSYSSPNYQFMEDMGSEEYVINYNDISYAVSINGNILRNTNNKLNNIESIFYKFHEELKKFQSELITNLVAIHEINKY